MNRWEDEAVRAFVRAWAWVGGFVFTIAVLSALFGDGPTY